MCVKIFATAVKNLFRSAAFWFLFILMLIYSCYFGVQSRNGNINIETGEWLKDTDSAYQYTMQYYTQDCSNVVGRLLGYGMTQLFSIVLATQLLFRDYKDGFYEIEKSGGISPASYLFGRMLASISVASASVLLINYTEMSLYVFTHQMVEGMTVWQYLIDSFIRISRLLFVRIVPCIAFYVCLSYMIGAIFKSGIAGAVGSVSYLLIHQICKMFFWMRMPVYLVAFAPPTPRIVTFYFHQYDSDYFDPIMPLVGKILKIEPVDVLLALGLVWMCVCLFFGIMFFAQRKRTF